MYFSTIQHWLPFLNEKVSKDRLHVRGLIYDVRLTLLLLSMKLAVEVPSEQNAASRLPLYKTAVGLSWTIEKSELICQELVQSVILISVYESGHDLYPAAFITVGRAVRLGLMMGFHDNSQSSMSPSTWMLQEEQRRTWWTVVVMDR